MLSCRFLLFPTRKVGGVAFRPDSSDEPVELRSFRRESKARFVGGVGGTFGIKPIRSGELRRETHSARSGVGGRHGLGIQDGESVSRIDAARSVSGAAPFKREGGR